MKTVTCIVLFVVECEKHVLILSLLHLATIKAPPRTVLFAWGASVCNMFVRVDGNAQQPSRATAVYLADLTHKPAATTVFVSG